MAPALAQRARRRPDGRRLTLLEHLDTTNNVSQRENAKGQLAAATVENPRAIINVGIFGEGTDSPSLSAVAFLESRKSPIDVIQAVGRAMRTAPDKSMGYIICPFLIPPNADAETWLSNSSPEEGWQELGQILLALRAHDHAHRGKPGRAMLHLYLPKAPREGAHLHRRPPQEESKRIQYWTHEGRPGDAQEAVEHLLKGGSPRLTQQFTPVPASAEFLPPVQAVVEAKITDDLFRTGEGKPHPTSAGANPP